MKILQSHQNYLSMLGINLYQSQQKYPFNVRNVWTISMLSLAAISSSIQFVYVAESFNEYTNALYSASAMTAATMAFAIILHKMRPLADFFIDFESIINERLKNPRSKAALEETNLQVEKSCTIVVWVTMTLVYPSVMFSKFLISFFAYFTDLGNDAFELPFPYWFPFDWKNPRGYLTAFILQFTMLIGLYLFMACAASLGIGIYMWIAVLIDDIKSNLIFINENVNFMENNQIHLLELLIDTIRLHSIVKKLFRDVSKLTQPIFTILFSWGLITMCGASLIIRMELSHAANLMVLVVPMVEWFASFALILLSCELAEQIRIEFDDINEILNQSDWYLFSMEILKLLPTIMVNTQRSVYLKCFGGIPCSRETFKKVINTGFSYFMVLREFEN